MKRQAAIEAQALDWLIRRESEDWDEQGLSELNAWLDQSMAHKAAFWRAEHGWRQADRIGSLGPDQSRTGPGFGGHKTWRPAAIAASLAAVLVISGLAFMPHLIPDAVFHKEQARFETALGARRIVSLADGSKVELNTQTALRTDIGLSKRTVWLDAGEAFFEIAHRDGEPFVVRAGRQTITVLGTKFSVRRDRDRVTVNVLEGRVRVDNSQGASPYATIISAGDTSISRETSTLVAGTSVQRVENALAWRDGRLSFDQAPLMEVVAEFNRYNRTRLVVTDEAAGQIPIGGSFQASSVDSFARLLRDAYGLRIEHDQATIKISSP